MFVSQSPKANAEKQILIRPDGFDTTEHLDPNLLQSFDPASTVPPKEWKKKNRPEDEAKD